MDSIGIDVHKNNSQVCIKLTMPAHFMLVDPDGNPILVDQHVPKPKR